MPDVIDVLVPPPPDDRPAQLPTTKSKRPTTRAGRKAAAEARKAAGGDSRPKPAKAATPAPRKATLETRLTDQLVGIGTIVAGVGAATGNVPVQLDGVLVIQQSASLAEALDQVAKNDPRVARALERMLTVGTYGALIGATVPLAVGIMANHGMVPPAIAEQLGVELPEVELVDAPPAGGTGAGGAQPGGTPIV